MDSQWVTCTDDIFPAPAMESPVVLTGGGQDRSPDVYFETQIAETAAGLEV